MLAHLALGDAGHPGAKPDGARLRSRVSRTRARRLVAAPREQPLVARLDAGRAPTSWNAAAGRVYPDSSGEVLATRDVPIAGRYDAWVAGGRSRSRHADRQLCGRQVDWIDLLAR